MVAAGLDSGGAGIVLCRAQESLGGRHHVGLDKQVGDVREGRPGRDLDHHLLLTWPRVVGHRHETQVPVHHLGDHEVPATEQHSQRQNDGQQVLQPRPGSSDGRRHGLVRIVVVVNRFVVHEEIGGQTLMVGVVLTQSVHRRLTFLIPTQHRPVHRSDARDRALAPKCRPRQPGR